MVESDELRTTPDKPRRRAYRTGESLPALETDFRPIQLGRDSTGKPDSQIRAFAVAVLNRSDSTVYVREGEEGDEIAVDRFESYDIWETNGVSRLFLRGENGGEEVVVRTLEAHNDFGVKDKIDAFIRAVSHFLNSSKSETVITSTETNFDIGTINDGIDVDSINTDITVGTINDGISVDNGTISVDSIPDVTIGTINDGITVDDGNVNASVSGNVVVDDISATSANFDGDITGQNDFDISVLDRTGKRNVRFLSDSNSFQSTAVWTLYENVGFDGLIEYVSVRLYDTDNDPDKPINSVGPSVEVDEGDGTGYHRVSPRSFRSPLSAVRYSGMSSNEVSIPYRSDRTEIMLRFEPVAPISFTSGDSVRIRIADDPVWGVGSTTATYQVEIEAGIRERIRDTL